MNVFLKVPRFETATPKLEKGRLSTQRDIASKAIDGIKDIISGAIKFLPIDPLGSLDTLLDIIPGSDELKKIQNIILSEAQVIFPGTKWCGDGNISKCEEDLGLFSSTDACCRSHDMCNNFIMPGDQKYGLENSGLFSRFHCDCDIEFYDCLYESSKTSIVSTNIGITYFNILGPQCFNEEYPIKRCMETIITTSNLTKCALYELDTTAKPVYQWFDSKLFIPYLINPMK
ncbi:phospholipase A2-like [Chrysoperla carnea]|uniref:phospholipase A2-like n=1 Tax=Chrysoperla carnea TaxID=189513 RepID=UPI001D067B35|nr:phospholipase A2-like [Chrysoperla carnea]